MCRRMRPQHSLQIAENPEFFEPLLARLTEAGALETALVPAQLKKNRPGVILRVLCRKTDSEKIIGQIFRNSTTTGVRFFEVGRSVLSREIITIKTKWGKIPAKKNELPDGEIRIHPEYEHLRKIAAREKMSLIDLEREVIGQWRAQAKKV
jgi:pyridinium-3,5-bisthiocarboxylic acid mononucleotide nickel chelatase